MVRHGNGPHMLWQALLLKIRLVPGHVDFDRLQLHFFFRRTFFFFFFFFPLGLGY